jgi:serine/threonine protein kinase
LVQGTGIAGVQEGDLLAGKYRVDRILGVGGMGVVVAAHHVQLDDKVAIKFLLPEILGNPEAVARFTPAATPASPADDIGRFLTDPK